MGRFTAYPKLNDKSIEVDRVVGCDHGRSTRWARINWGWLDSLVLDSSRPRYLFCRRHRRIEKPRHSTQ